VGENDVHRQDPDDDDDDHDDDDDDVLTFENNRSDRKTTTFAVIPTIYNHSRFIDRYHNRNHNRLSFQRPQPQRRKRF
jgi:hypothetical protein